VNTPTITQATPKQVAFIARLVAEGRGPGPDGELSRQAASQVIDALLAAPRSGRVAEPVTEPGMYQGADGIIYKVQRSKQDETRLYAKKLTPIGGERLRAADDAVVQWEFVYAPGAVRDLRPEQRLTLEQAQQFGIRYGVCCVCGAFLKDATSVAQGIGPVCAKRQTWRAA
jgi:Family of unknown function (DUF6011)